MNFKKITTGFVIQTYRDKKCIGQEFIAGDQVDWENEKGEGVPYQENHEYQCFDMVQPDDGVEVAEISRQTIPAESGPEARERLVSKYQNLPRSVRVGEKIPNKDEAWTCMADPRRDPDTITLQDIDHWCESRGQKIGLICRIKSVRELTNLGLKESKDLVDSLI